MHARAPCVILPATMIFCLMWQLSPQVPSGHALHLVPFGLHISVLVAHVSPVVILALPLLLAEVGLHIPVPVTP